METIMEIVTKTEMTSTPLTPTRFENSPALRLAGLQQRYTYENRGTIPALWQRFAPSIGTVPGQMGMTTYGVILSTPDGTGFDYMAAVGVSDGATLPADFITREIPAHQYAVFAHGGHLSTLCETIDDAFRKWLPTSGYEPTLNPDFFERYGEQFNPATETGDIEIWLPVKGGKETR